MFSLLKKYSLLLTCLSILFPNATVTGKINDSNSKEPLIGVNVVLLETTKKVEMFGDIIEKRTITVQVETNYGASTDIEGEFIIKNVPLGDYTFKAMYIGYENKEIPISIDENRSYTFNIELSISEIALEETKVTAVYEREEKKTEAPATIETVSSKEIEQATTSNLGTYLQGLKGVDFTASGVNNYSLSIRGFNSSFSTRLLMLTDGRPANVPSLRVVNFSTIPVTSDDVERIEVVLGPATALYGANAHSGVINIISKAPSLSEGFSASFSGTADERNIKKFNARYAKKITDKLSFKVSGSHFSAVEWPFISESEYKSHRNPWVGFPGRIIDRKDNNPSITRHTGGLSPQTENTLRWIWKAEDDTLHKGIQIHQGQEGGGPYNSIDGWAETMDLDGDEVNEPYDLDGLYYIMMGDGEPNHGDLDGDGIAGEDWFNGRDDDGDGSIDEDYWEADGEDNFEPWTDSCVGITDEGYLCSDDWFDFLDENGDSVHQGPEPFYDANNDGEWNEGEWWQDLPGNGYTDFQYDDGEKTYEEWEDWDLDGAYDNKNGDIDELIDREEDEWVDGVDNNGNGLIDEGAERYTTNQFPSQWANAIDDQNVLIRYGRLNQYLVDGSLNPWYIEDEKDGIDNDGDGVVDEPYEGFAGRPMDKSLRGRAMFNEETFLMEYDVFQWDFGSDGVAGDYYYDHHGDGEYVPGEPGVPNIGGGYSDYNDYGLDGFQYYLDLDEDIDGDGNLDGHQAIWRIANQEGDVVEYPVVDIDGNPIWIEGPDEGENDGIFQPGDTWNDDGDFKVSDTEAGWDFLDSFELVNQVIGFDDDGDGIVDNCFTIGDPIIVTDENGNQVYDNCWIDPNTGSSKILEEGPNPNDFFYQQIQDFNDLYVNKEPSANVTYDMWPPPDGVFGENDIVDDCGQDGHCWDFSALDQNIPQAAKDIWGELKTDDDDNFIYIDGPDFGEGDGEYIGLDQGDYDGEYDTSDGVFAVLPEPFTDCNDDQSICYGDTDWENSMGNGIWNEGEEYQDLDGNQNYTQGDWHPDLALVKDTNGDGLDDFPDFEVINNKAEVRIDYDPNSDLNITFQSGYAFTKTQQVTGVGRYLADGWESTYFQLRGKYKNWYAQGYFNANDAGKTRGYNLGDVIIDQSTNYGFQIQNFFNLPKYQTEFTWGFDYMRTNPFTDGSVLNDGPNGFDDDEDSDSYVWDYVDHAQDDDGTIYGDEDDRAFGIDEADEYQTNILSNELGLYFQSKTEFVKYAGMLRGQWEFITSARLDYHDQLKDEGILFGPKLGLTYKPNNFTTWRMSYGKAFNTPTITALYTNLIFGKWGEYFTMILKGNRSGTIYARADNQEEFGELGYNIELQDPFYYEITTDQNGDWEYSNSTVKINVEQDEGLDYCGQSVDCQLYNDRIQGAPLFFNTGDADYPSDYIPLDTLNHIIFIPSAYDDGVDYTPEESVNLSNVDPLRSETMRTLEFGVKSFVTKKSLLSAELYFTRYNDFFSPATFITPLVKDRFSGDVIGLIPTDLDGTNPPYSTAWDGIDNDNDWSGMGYYVEQTDIICYDSQGNTHYTHNNDTPLDPSDDYQTPYLYPCGFDQASGTHYMDYFDLESDITDTQTDWADIFQWSFDDKNGDCLDEFIINDLGEESPNPEFDPACYQDPGEWGYVDILCQDGGLCDVPDESFIYTIIQPDQIWDSDNADDPGTNLGSYGNIDDRWLDVGVDEYSTTMTGHFEAEIIDEETGRKGFPNKLPIITLSSLNYGTVYHSGIDLGFTHFFSERFIVDFNFTYFNSTDYYNELTKRYDPINAPKFKFNLAANLSTKKMGDFLLKLRYVDKFDWADGTWSGAIGPYSIIDLHYNFNISDYLKFGITAMNLFDDRHTELIGGAKMGRQVLMRLTTSF